MATLATNTLTLVDFAKRLDPSTNSVTSTIAELLSQTNEILTDMQWKEGNLPTGHRLTMRTGLPSVAWRKLNQGVAASKSTTAQVDEGCGMLEALGVVDKDLAMLNGNTSAFRLSENSAFLEAMNITMAQTLFYGDSETNPEQFLGLAPRYSTISGAVNGQNVISGGSVSGGDGTSIWLVGWGPNSVYGVFPKGSKAGLIHEPGSGDEWAFDASNNRFKAYIDRYQWKCGIALADWRYVVRICNIDVSNLVTESGQADVIKLMSRALDRLPTMAGIKPVFYMNRTVFSMLKIQGLNKSANAVTVQDGLNQFGAATKDLSFLGVPIRKCDAILNTEAQIS